MARMAQPQSRTARIKTTAIASNSTFTQMTPMTSLRVALAALICSIASLAHADDWAHKQKITLDTTATGADLKQATSQTPIVVRLHSGNFAFVDAKPDGSDLRFMAADGKTPLKFHL